MCVCVCRPPGLRRLPAIHALTSPQLEGRGSGVLLSLYLHVFVREKHLLTGCGQIRFIFIIPRVRIGGWRVCVCVSVCAWPHLCVSPAIFPASRGFALISSWIPLECSDRFTWIRSEPASTPPKPSAFNIKLQSSLLPLKCRACIWVQSHVLSPAPP